MSPTIAVVTNIDREHLDYYHDLNHIKDVFLSFIDKIPFYGIAVLCLDDEPIQDIIPRIHKRFTTYGMSTQADFQAKDIVFEGLKSKFRVYHLGKELGSITLNLPGVHNVYNSLSSIAVGTELDIPFDVIASALQTVEGVQRRLEIKGESKGIVVIDDYGHHPAEIKVTLEAVREGWPGKRIVAVFQPHRYSRAQALFDDFTRSFYQSDLVVVLPIYSAGEEKIEGVTGHALFEGIRSHGHRNVIYVEDFQAAVLYLKEALVFGDILLTLGAGDVWKLGEMILEEMKNNVVRRNLNGT